MARVYLETSFVSALVSRRKDLNSLYRHRVSLEWWQTQSRHHELFISDEVVTELSHPRYPQSRQALSLINNLPALDVSGEVRGFARILIREKVMPGPVAGDAIHVSIAAVHRVAYLLSWNVRHLANPNKLEHLAVICRRMGYVPPKIVTPDLLWEIES